MKLLRVKFFWIGMIFISLFGVAQTVETIKWGYFLGAEIISSPTLGKDAIYVTCHGNGTLFALNLDGTLKWKFKAGDRIVGSAVVFEDKIVINSLTFLPEMKAYFYLLNPDGSIIWQFCFPGFPNGTPAIAKDGTIYFAATGFYQKNIRGIWIPAHESRIYAIKDGVIKWIFRVEDSLSFSSPVVGQDETIYFGCEKGYLYSISPEGKLKWAFRTGDSVSGSSPAIGKNGEIYFGSKDGYFYALYPDGKLKWKYYTGKRDISPPVIGPEDEIYFTGDGCLFALTADGKLKLKLEEWAYPMGTPAIGIDNTIYYGTSGGYLMARTLDGEQKWRIKTKGPIIGAPILGPDGTIYYTCVGGYVYAAQASKPANTPWPLFHHDAQHTGRAH